MKRLFASLLSMAFLTLGYAQSASEISMAKSLARQYGYSEAEINSMLQKRNTSRNQVTGLPQASSSTALIGDQISTEESEAAYQWLPGTEEEWMLAYESEFEEPADSSGIFGHDFFLSKGLAYAPNYNMQAPENYVLGPGDELVIDIWGTTTSNMVLTIGNDGSITLSDLGPVYLSGMSVKAAERMLTEQFSRVYSSLAGENPDTFLRLGVNKIKNVNVNVVGEVKTPGVYTIPSLSTLTSAIFLAGGITENAGLRNIRLVRDGKTVGEFDLYDFILDGKYDSGLRMQENDVIVVSPYTSVVTIEGQVVRPMRYEMKADETVADLIRFAGNFTRKADRSSVNVLRNEGPVGSSYDVFADNYSSWALEDEDVVEVRLSFTDTYDNNVTLSGAVTKPGKYAIGGSITDIRSLLTVAGGLLENAFPTYGRITRFDERRQPVTETFDIAKVMTGQSESGLVRGDSVYIFSMDEIRGEYIVNIGGSVNAPGDYAYNEGMTLADLILTAKGVTEDAYLLRAQIERFDSNGAAKFLSFVVSDVLDGKDDVKLYYSDHVHIFSMREIMAQATVTIGGQVNTPKEFKYFEGVTIRDLILMAGGLSDGADISKVEVASRGGVSRGEVNEYDLISNPESYEVALKPYDVVSVKRLTYFRPQQTVTVQGEVITPGPYTVDESEVRLSQVISRTGGFTPEAYVEGAQLSRLMSDEEKNRQQTAEEIALLNKKNSEYEIEDDDSELEETEDSITVIEPDERFTIGIDLQKAIDNPGSIYDVVLRSGDIISIPQMNNTVKISGSVFHPNTVVYDNRMSWKKYVRMAGGFAKNAQKKNVYVVYMNGEIATRGHGLVIKPGCEIVVPEKPLIQKEGLSPAEIASITSTTSSMVTLVYALIRLL